MLVGSILKVMNGFKKFILRGNVVDLAVGVMIGAAFNSIVSSLVKDIFTPLIGVIAKVPDLSGLSYTIRASTFNYGTFLNTAISFMITAAAIYFGIVLPVNKLIERSRKDKPTDPTTKRCTECLSEINIAAKRCSFCAQPQPASSIPKPEKQEKEPKTK